MIPQTPHVALVNESTVVTTDQLDQMCSALQHQVSYHFKPWWGRSCVVTPFPAGALVPPTSWVLALLDDSDQAGALGYHDETSSGNPLGKVFAKTDQQYGYNVNITASHELLEMLADPWVEAAVQIGTSTFYALEVCDPCEADELGYPINVTLNGVTHPVMVSDFILPHWFDGLGPPPYDYRGHIGTARELLPGGYIGVWSPTKGWTQKSADGAPTSRRIPMRQKKQTLGLQRSTGV